MPCFHSLALILPREELDPSLRFVVITLPYELLGAISLLLRCVYGLWLQRPLREVNYPRYWKPIQILGLKSLFWRSPFSFLLDRMLRLKHVRTKQTYHYEQLVFGKLPIKCERLISPITCFSLWLLACRVMGLRKLSEMKTFLYAENDP